MKRQNTKCVPCFKRWSRKGYAVFASLHREVKIGVLALTMATATAQAMATEVDTTRTERLEVVSITALRGSAAARSLSEPTVVVDPSMLTYGAVNSVENALDLSPRFDVRSRGARGTQADISIRGASPDQAMILLNGVNFTDARTGHQSHSLPLPIASIAAVDFIPNTQSIGAYSGALDYRTPTVDKNSLDAQISGGEYGTWGAALSAGLRGKRSSLYFASSYDQSDGYIKNTDYSKLNIFLRGRTQSEKFGSFDFQAGYQLMDFGANGFYSSAYPDQWEATRTALTSLTWSKVFARRLRVSALVSYRLNTDRYELYRPGHSTPPDTYKGGNYHLTDNVGASVWASWDWGKAGVTSAGVDFSYNNILSTVLGEAADPRTLGAITYNHAKDRNAASYYVRHSLDLGRVDLGASVSANVTSDYGTLPLWSVMAGWDIVSGLRAELSAIASMRLPTFTDLYYTTPTHIGNSALVPERAVNLNLSLDYTRGAWSVGGATYYRMGRDIIDWVRPAHQEKWHSEQITELSTFGVEFTAAYRPSRGALAAVRLSYGYINTDKATPDDYMSKYALDYMRHKASAAVDFRILPNLIWNVTGSLYDRNGVYQDTAGAMVAYSPYFLLDSRITWTIARRVSLWVECSNVLDAGYFDFAGLPLPGRWLMGGVRVSII